MKKTAKKQIKRFSYGGDVLGNEAETIASENLRRLKNLEKQQALEGVYPEELVMPGSLLRGAGKKMATEAKELRRIDDLMSRPKISNKLYAEGSGSPDLNLPYAMRRASQAEIDDIVKSGFMRTRELPAGWKGKPAKESKYFTVTQDPMDRVKKASQNLRVKTEKIPADRAVRREDVEIYDEKLGKFRGLKKGGKVTRGDGIAKRGKTKGRFI
jgi:hypothetical protein